ncbi:MAG: hypothetical protein Q7J25_08320 [Vicinamibacterales bacterium]|nr:hypothetical protein [Vicinamibacterales bacterium]
MALLTGLLSVVLARPVHTGQATRPFATTVAALSEEGGYFDTDNLISNERSYAEALPALDAPGLAGGVYIGVGPDQNFSYIARLRPSVAYLVDIRRDNLLLHLLFKALFTLADSRADYVCLLVGCTVPADARAALAGADGARLAAWVDAARGVGHGVMAPDARIASTVAGFGVPLGAEDQAAITRFHQSFLERGLGLQFQSFGRPPQRFYPSYRDLMQETDAAGGPAHFLASERGYLVVRDLQRADAVIPVVGDLAGTGALAAIAKRVEADGRTVSAVYTSNVEYYLFGAGRFDAFAANLARLPRVPGAVIIRAVFATAGGRPRPGYGSESRAASIAELLTGHAAGRVRGYGDLLP